MATYKTLMLDVETVQGGTLAGATVYVSYDRTVRLSGGGIIPDPASNGVAVPVTGTASVQVLASDDPDLTTDSAGFGITVRIVWTEAPSWHRQSKTYVAQVHVADAATVNLSDHLATVATSGVTVLQGPVGPAGPTGLTGPAGTVTDSSVAAVVGSVNTKAALDTTTASLASTSTTTTFTTLRQRMDARSGLIATEWGAKFDGATDDTAALQAMINSSSDSANKVILPAGVSVITSLTVGPYAQIEGISGQMSLFGRDNTAPGGAKLSSCVLVHANGIGAPALVVNGGGISLRNFAISGGTNTTGATLLDVQYGFELFIERVRVLQNLYGTGAHFGLLGNATIRRFHADLCGSAAMAAVRFDSDKEDGTVGNSNTISVYDMHIERVTGTALDIATGTSNVSYVEMLRFFGLHCEAPIGPDLGALNPSSTKPLVDIGNAAMVEFQSPYLFQGGGAPIMHHKQDMSGAASALGLASLPQTKGVYVNGGLMLGSDTTRTFPTGGGAIPAMPYAVVLETGDAFNLNGTSIYRAGTNAVQIQSGYGPNVAIAPSRKSPDVVSLADARTGAVTPQRPYRQTWTVNTASDIAVNSTTPVDIASQTIFTSRIGFVEVKIELDLSYAVAGDLLIFNAFVGSSQMTGSMVVQGNAGTSRFPWSHTYRLAVAANQNVAVKVQGLRSSGTGTHTVKANSHMIVTYEATP